MVSHVWLLLLTSVLTNSLGFNASQVDDVEVLQDAFVNFDEDGKKRQSWLSRLQRAKSHCSWEQDVEKLEYKYDSFPNDRTLRADYWGYLVSQLRITTYWPALPKWLESIMYYLFITPLQGPELQSHSCRVVGSEGDEFRIRRLGPFVSRGGFDWHKMKLEDPYNLRSAISGDAMSMTGFGAMPVDENGEILGNPPIHVHHANLGPNCDSAQCRRSSLRRVSQWHGDSQCSATAGGTACYITVLPEGFGFPVVETLRLDADFNDVRPEGSPDLHFWLETAISIVKPTPQKPKHELGTVILGVPFRCEWWKTNPDLQRLYFVPPNQPSALWATARMPTSGTFVTGKLETHQHFFDVAWVFTGVSPEDLGLNSDTWQLRKPWQPWQPQENGWSDSAAAMLALKKSIHSNFKRAVNRCTEQVSCKKPPSLVWTLDRIVIENDEDRQMPWPKGNWTFEEGDQYTVVIMHKAMEHGGMAHPGATSVEVDWLIALANFGGSGASDAQLGSSLWLCAVLLACIVVPACTSIWCITIILRKTPTSMVRCCSAQRNQIENILREVKVRRKKYFPVPDDNGTDKNKVSPEAGCSTSV